MMSAAFELSSSKHQSRSLYLAIVAGLACALALSKVLPPMVGAVSALVEPLCMASDPAGSTLDKVGADRLLCIAERAGQARHHRAGVLWPRRLYPSAPPCRFGDGLC